MSVTNIHEAKTQLSKLIERAEAGEEVIIARAGKPVAKIVAYKSEQRPRQGGQWKGRVKLAEDFDVLPADIAESFGMLHSNLARKESQ